MANKFEVNGQILTITDTVTNKTLVKSPKADLFYYIEALEATIPSIKLYDISGANSSGGATTFNCLLSTAVDSTNTAFTVETFKTFADSNLGFKSASLETDPVFGSSEASLFVSGDKAKLDNTWLKGGNAGTNPANNFIGTTDANGLSIRTNGTEKVFINDQAVGGEIIFKTDFIRHNTESVNEPFFFTKYNDSNPTYTVNIRSSRGTFAAPTALIANNIVSQLNFRGYNGSNFDNVVARIRVSATEAQTTVNKGGQMTFQTTPNGNNSPITRVLIEQNGNVGIGTTSPTKILDINGELRIRTLPTGLNTENILVVNGSGDVRSIAPTTLQSGTAGQVAFFNGTNVQGGSNNLFWDNANSRLGIGTNTPGYPLAVSNNNVLGNTAGDTQPIAEFANNQQNAVFLRLISRKHTTGTDWDRSNLRLQKTVDVTPMGFIDFGIDGVSSDNGLGFGVGSTTQMVLRGGNVGIGTTAPSFALDVRNGSVYAHNGSFFLSEFNDVAGSQFFGKKYTATGSIIAGMEIENTSLGGNYSQKLHFRTHHFAVNEGRRMTIDENGNVGIGTTDPTSKLQVVGLPSYADNAAALGGGLTVGAFYHTGGNLKVVI